MEVEDKLKTFVHLLGIGPLAGIPSGPDSGALIFVVSF